MCTVWQISCTKVLVVLSSECISSFAVMQLLLQDHEFVVVFLFIADYLT